MMNVYEAAEEYCDRYDLYQTMYAKYRLKGWNGNLGGSPADLRIAHEAMTEALRHVKLALGRDDQRSFVKRAQEILRAEEEAENNDS